MAMIMMLYAVSPTLAAFFITVHVHVISVSALVSPMPLSSPCPGHTIITLTNGRTSPLARRTSSLAYDNGSKKKYSRQDLRRQRSNSPAKTISTTTALESSSSLSNGEIKPLYTFGVLADIQYAPIPDGYSYGGNPRYYRHAKKASEHAAKHFQEEKVQCVVNLGDIVDGKCADVERWGGSVRDGRGGEEIIQEEKKASGNVGHEAIDEVLEALSAYKSGNILHTYGNHELYNLSRREISQKLSIPFKIENDDLVGYYDHLLNVPEHRSSVSSFNLRFLVIDSYDVCLLDRCAETSPKRQTAHEILTKHNPNYPEQENSPEGLAGLSKRFVGFNGGVDTPQMEWLEQSLKMARENNEKVIVCSHQPIHPDSTWPTCLIWNFDEILAILRTYDDVVIASFSGHAHKGGYVRDEMSGIHFRTFEAMLESPEPISTYAIVDVWEDHLVVRGLGDCVSDVYDLDHLNLDLKSVHSQA